MKLYQGLPENSLPHETRIFAEIEGKLIDLKLACAACVTRTGGNSASAYERATAYFPGTIAAFLDRGEAAERALDEVVSFAGKSKTGDLRGPAGEKVAYGATEIRLLPPFQNPEKSFVIGFSDRARTEALPKAELPTGFYKLPQTFVTSGAPILWPKFSEELDADACLAVVIGKAGRRIPADKVWEHVAGATLLIDITARDVNRREGLTTNNLLGKNFPSSTCLGPALWLKPAREELASAVVTLSVDGSVRQQFSLGDCVFTIEQIITRWSILGVKPGDFLAIGASMALQGDRLQNPAPLKIGGRMACSSPAIGELSHTVVSSKGMHR
jgi:5-carboxymethyl-2-hydroxymuconate isomerase